MSDAGERKTFKRAGQYLVYLLFRAMECVLMLIPLRVCAFIGEALGLLAYLIIGRYRKLVLRNLTIAFGREKDASWCRQMVRKHFQTLGGNFVCCFKLPLMPQSQIVKRVVVEGLENIAADARYGEQIVYAVCHLSAWELLTQVPSLFTFGQKPASIYRALSNPFLEAHLKRNREKLNYTLFDRAQGFAGPMKHLREGGIMGVLVDQHAGDRGLWCPFFDRLASTSMLASLMALRCRARLVPLAVYTDAPARWRMVFYPSVDSQEATSSAEGLTAAMNVAVEKMIRRSPADWFWVHNRWKTPRPNFLLSQVRRGWTVSQGYDMERLQKFKMLVRSPNWLGDACMALPAIRALKKGRPDAHITVIAPAKLAELWRAIPEVDAVILKENKSGIFEVARRIREAGVFDAAILFTNSTRSTLEIWWAGVPRLVGYRGSLRSWFIHQRVPEPPKDTAPEHHTERYLRIAKYCGAAVDEELLAPSRPVIEDGSCRIGICAGAEYGIAKRWPLERFAEVANRLSVRVPKAEWLLFGAPGEKAMGEQLSAMMPQALHINYVGKTSLTELIAHLKSCRVLLTNDTGTMHLAASLGVPTVSIFGSTEPALTRPLGEGHIVIRNQVPCSPCFERECPLGHFNCMMGVSVERVEAELMRALTEQVAS